MKTGVIRELDQLGRVTLPKEFRKTLGIRESEPIEICLEGDSIRLRPCRLQCVCCGTQREDKLVEKNGVHICSICIEALSQEVMIG